VGPLSPERHLVTAGRALAWHGLSDQAFRQLIVLTPKLQREWQWQGETVRYVLQPEEKIWGGREIGPARSPTLIARPERAILDSLTHPSWGVSLHQIVEAIRIGLSRDQKFAERLAQATARYDNAFAARRLGFIVSRLAGNDAAASFRGLIGTSRAITPLESGGQRKGPVHAEWRLRENVPFELLAAGSEQ
jgi:predicted transcriptional regulator of viral defense system